MKWSKVRSMYPNKFIKFEILKSYIESEVEVVEEINLLGIYDNGKDAMKEYLRCKQGQYVHSTVKERIEIEIIHIY